jgi:hypothetical protein
MQILDGITFYIYWHYMSLKHKFIIFSLPTNSIWLKVKVYICACDRTKENCDGKGWRLVMSGWHTKNEVHVASYPRDYVHTTYSDTGNTRSNQRDWIWRIYHSKRLEGKSCGKQFYVLCFLKWWTTRYVKLNLISKLIKLQKIAYYHKHTCVNLLPIHKTIIWSL